MRAYEDILCEVQDGVAHYLEKRAPKFGGR